GSNFIFDVLECDSQLFVMNSLAKDSDCLKDWEPGSQQRRQLLVEKEKILSLYLFDVLFTAKRASNAHGSWRCNREDPEALAFELVAQVAFGCSFHRSGDNFPGRRA